MYILLYGLLGLCVFRVVVSEDNDLVAGEV